MSKACQQYHLVPQSKQPEINACLIFVLYATFLYSRTYVPRFKHPLCEKKNIVNTSTIIQWNFRLLAKKSYCLILVIMG